MICWDFDHVSFFQFKENKVSKQVPHFSNVKKAFSPKVLELRQLRYHVKTTHERCGPFSLVVLSQRRGRVTTFTCLEVWSGDHRQTPGGLKKSKESKSFRKKLTKRPLALRCQTQYTQAHDLGGIAMRYLDCPETSFPWKIRQLLENASSAIDPAVARTWHDLIGDSTMLVSRNSARCLRHSVDGLRGEREGLPSMLATSFAEAAGVAGRQKWGLVLSSSARVSQVTYQTVVGVRYPELVTFNGTSWNFGKFVAKSSLAVLHNRNDMTNLFRASNWVSESQDSIVLRGVTTCAGIDSPHSPPCPNQSWFPDWRPFLALPEEEQMVQLFFFPALPSEHET